MADPATAPGATPESDATSGAVIDEASPEGADGTTPEPEVGDAAKRALAEIRREAKRQKARADALEAEKREREQAEQTELERVASERDSLQREVARLEFEGRARTAAAAHGIPDLWDRLRGESEEDLDEDAKAMAERFGTRPPQPADLGAGPRPPAPASGDEAMNERIRRARR